MMVRFLTASAITFAVFVSAAYGSVTRAYLQAYHATARKYGQRAPGRNIVRWGLPNDRHATAKQVAASLAVLNRMLAPPPNPIATTFSPGSSFPASNGLTACIISHESTGNPQVVNSSGHMGMGQWDQATWVADGGARYAPTPLGASAAEQQQVIATQVAAGNTSQWTNYDGC
jgi:hypothetical protein